jgi:hypothetical protein
MPHLVYSLDLEEIERPPFGVLSAFIRLRQAGAEEVAGFMRSYGPLEICEHGFPGALGPDLFSHRGGMVSPCGEKCAPLAAVEPKRPLPWWQPLEDGEGRLVGWWEPLEAWHRLSRHAYAVLVAAACYREGRPFPKELIAWLADVFPSTPPYRRLPDNWRGREPNWAWRLTSPASPAPSGVVLLRLVEEGVDLWAHLGQLRPTVVHGRGGLEAGICYSGLPGLIAVELLSAVATPRGIYLCDACGDPFTVPEWKRRPRRDRRRYCLPCQFGTDDPEELERALDEGRRSPSLAAKREWARRHRAGSRPSDG